ncbi:type II toxin-antitoxin system Phd/YefM family antitoxin [Gymnodinialimonas sp.]
MQKIDASIAASVSELKKSPTAVIDDAEGSPVAILNHNRVMAYLVPAATYEAMLDRLDDLDLVEIARTRASELPANMSIEEL